VSSPHLQPEELFEEDYTLKFQGLVHRRGLIVTFARDRAALDMGIMLNQLGTLELSGTKVWFQLKGVHRKTITADALARTGHVPISVRLRDLRFWYAAPEATYLVVYVEAMDAFLAEDIRDIVDRQWGVKFLEPGRFGTQETITVHVAAEAVLDDRTLDSMVAHHSMRIDGPAFRGRPLGHRLDPLRCGFAELDPDVFDRVVHDLLQAHLFTNMVEWDSTRLIAGGTSQRVRLLTGTLRTTYEYPFAGSIEIGFGPEAAPREEGQWFRAFGPVAVVVHSVVELPFQRADDAQNVLAALEAEGFEHVLVFANAPDLDLLFPYRSLLGERCRVPQGLQSIAYNVLVATLVYLDHQEHLRWDLVNYNYEV
jgi:hypothetical protein